MSGVVIKKPNLKRLLAGQREELASFQPPVHPIPEYLGSPLPYLSNPYHIRGTLMAVEQEPEPNHEADGGKQLMADIMNERARICLEVEKTLALTCRVLDKAAQNDGELTELARESLARLTVMGEDLSNRMITSRE
ncbi:uncharacterized protein TEOVI_000208800 [Trypanosoma equiperdum]|uniref:Uncharacterized protein n=5 Tax=Trypanozoon TaxID=39700 RepID=Q57Z10_TRYB2|nr:hypothetical protein, conserved [Trypanosoma brucei gambiense DAL972]XP_845109.1 hypothetical protein, conserved [Trypanosoma brucei brucei TREU927]AAX70755.1 hypothetical protein, conserved [Trypanosoma brucei]RHW72659.1 hypothetical protein DPX39_050049800 [Trypanosoma brucei equiperdum]SCU70514.1 hypothetical protein, conserved [Trypanosoma equiperdum]AAX80588.1 hypothetical protein, conserved [Trypanosoma brucei]AAZ11550.1 hypothetical protein, conserved [Trypanosoma brucei brucei TREU|eukprot:XP_011773740.1 hypothetical protein, conserved [Trypanosoma brucei gambiense DAL972]